MTVQQDLAAASGADGGDGGGVDIVDAEFTVEARTQRQMVVRRFL